MDKPTFDLIIEMLAVANGAIENLNHSEITTHQRQETRRIQDAVDTIWHVCMDQREAFSLSSKQRITAIANHASGSTVAGGGHVES